MGRAATAGDLPAVPFSYPPITTGAGTGGVSPVDLVNHPPHYTTGGMETIDFIEGKGLNYHRGQVVKYITRAAHKGTELQDLQKAKWYLVREIERLTNGR